jgi:adenylate cyclase
LEHGLRLSPYDPQNFSWFVLLAFSYYLAGEPARGLKDAKLALMLRPGWSPALTAAAVCSFALGDAGQAQSLVGELMACSDPRGDLIRPLLKYNPGWAERIDKAISAAILTGGAAVVANKG